MSRLGRAWRKIWAEFGGDEQGDDGLLVDNPGAVHAADGTQGGASVKVDSGQMLDAATHTDSSSAGSAEERLKTAEHLEDAAQEALATAAFDELVRAGHAARAVTLGRRALQRSEGGDALRVRVAEQQVSRADDEGALDSLETLLDASDTPVSVWAMAARALDRLGREAEASQLWQRVLARDVDYPGARQRVGRGVSAPASAGATLASGGDLSDGRYLVRRELGRGGAGSVFEALDKELGRPVALKVYHERGAAARVRLRLEARAAAALEHAGVIRIFDLDLELGAIAMEFVRGPSLASALKQPNIDPQDARRWLTTLIEALDFVHAAGLVHRDLKPSNVLLRRDQRAVLTDFGLALPVGTAPARAGEGTQGFAAPEQLRAAPASHAADIYALGVLLERASAAFSEDVGVQLTSLGQRCAVPDLSSRLPLNEVAEEFERIFRGA